MLRPIFYFILLVIVVSCTSEERNRSEYHEDQGPSETNLFFGDPFILLDGDTYYAYGTGQNSDTGIEAYKSNNLMEWEGPIGMTEGYALHEDDVYGEKWFWAPEVYEIDGQYYMFYSVEEHMAIAVSDDPKGPFVQEEYSLLADFKAIDHHLFIDDDGTKYIFFAKFEAGLEIWGAEIVDDFSSLKEETLTQLLTQTQDWEKSQKEPVGMVNEGPYILKNNGLYYMTYSANHYESTDYGIGFAYAKEPLGNWTKGSENPLIQAQNGLVGTGHNSFFEDKEGRFNVIYHTHFDTTEVHPRKVYYNKIQFVEEKNSERHRLKIISPTYKPKVISESE